MLRVVCLTIALVGLYQNLGIGSGFAVLIRRGIGVGVDCVHIVVDELGLNGLLGRMNVVLRWILAVIGWWVAHRPETRMALIQGLWTARSREVSRRCQKSVQRDREAFGFGSGSEKWRGRRMRNSASRPIYTDT